MKSVRGYLRVCLQSYELQSRIDPNRCHGNHNNAGQAKRKKNNPAGEDEEHKNWRKKNRKERERESQWLSEKRMFALPTAISGIRWKRGVFFHPLPLQGQKKKKSEGVKGKRSIFPSRKSLDGEIGLFLRWMLEFLVMILLQSMSEWEKVLCLYPPKAQDRLHPNYINNAKLKSREREKKREGISGEVIYVFYCQNCHFWKICILSFISHVQLLHHFLLLIEGEFSFVDAI